MQVNLTLNLKRSGPGERLVIFGTRVQNVGVLPMHTMKPVMWSGCILVCPVTLNLDARWK